MKSIVQLETSYHKDDLGSYLRFGALDTFLVVMRKDDAGKRLKITLRHLRLSIFCLKSDPMLNVSVSYAILS